MNIPEWLKEEAKARTPPAGSFTVSEFMAETKMTRCNAITFLEENVAAGKLECAKFKARQGDVWHYWPAPNPKERK